MTTVERSDRRRWLALGVVVIALTALTGVFIARAAQEQQRRSVPTAATYRDQVLDLGAVLDVPHIVFRSTASGPTYGRLAAVPLADPQGPRSVSTRSCERVYAVATAGVCLAAERGAVTTYSADLLTGRMADRSPMPITGIPSRARLSADGTWSAKTTFVSGHSYGTANFSTETTVVEVGSGRELGNLERTFTVEIEGKRVTAKDLNIWGVTFAAGPRPREFYATVATGGSTWLARGDLEKRTLIALRPDAECPSLSADGRSLVYKKRAGAANRWRLHVLDLGTGVERALAETRSIDDQAEWLDNHRVLYGLTRAGTAQADVWVVDTRPGAGAPRVFLPDAWSPAVVPEPAEPQ